VYSGENVSFAKQNKLLNTSFGNLSDTRSSFWLETGIAQLFAALTTCSCCDTRCN